MFPFDTTAPSEDDEEDIDPFAELQVTSSKPEGSSGDALSAFEDDDDDALSAFEDGDDLLSAFTDDEDDTFQEMAISFDDDDVPALESSNSKPTNRAEATYKLLLETVWVDDILDPSEVELLARKRGELGLSFERHLELVREIIGG